MKNKSFRNIFYLGLGIILLLTTLLTLISINIYRSFNGLESTKKKTDSSVIEIPLEKEVVRIHDTVFLEKTVVPQIVKPIDSPKQKKETKVISKVDSSEFVDSTK